MQDHDALWKRFMESRAVRFRDELVEIYRPLAETTLRRTLAKLPPHVDVAALESAAYKGLLDVIEKFDPGRGVKFETYAITRIRGAIYDEIRRIGDVGRFEHQRFSAAKQATDRLACELGRKPTTEEQEALDEVAAYRRSRRRPKTTSLDVPKYHTELSDKPVTAEMLLNARRVSGYRPTVRKAFLEEVLRSLDTEERIIFWARYRLGRTMKDTGEFLGLSESRVSQMHSEAIRQLQKRMDAGEAWEWLESETCE